MGQLVGTLPDRAAQFFSNAYSGSAVACPLPTCAHCEGNMKFTYALVRQFFTEPKKWIVPVALILFILCALTVVSDAPAFVGPFVFKAT
jgi:hypothetical protein